MTLSKTAILTLSSSLALLIAGLHPVHAASTATATVTIKANFTAPPCTLTVPDTVFLGSILQGEQTYRPFDVRITCPTSTSSALYAESVGGSVISGTPSRMAMSGPAGATGTPAQLWLNAEGKNVDLTGGGSTDSSLGFCAGNNDRTCTLTPLTQVFADTPRGQTTATVRFSVIYP